jgi:hypothetical protein
MLTGITLTAANRMFLLEPFLRLSEEQQAYGRCHRIGQTKPVQVTTYFSPISVESRLLEWRKRAAENGPKSDTTTNVVYNMDKSDSSVDGGADDDDDDDEVEESNKEEHEIQKQTRFLLNIHKTDRTDVTAST